jgi:hypothetical protein
VLEDFYEVQDSSLCQNWVCCRLECGFLYVEVVNL